MIPGGLVPALVGHRRAGDALALIAGLATPLAFAPFDLAFLAPLALAALFLSWLAASAARAFWRGWLFGAGMFGAGVSWVANSFLIMHVAPPVAIVLTAGLIALFALYPGMSAWLLRRFVPGPAALRLLVAFPAGWTLTEWLRGWLFTGFPWLELGYTQVDTPLRGWFAVLGVHGTTFALALSAGALAYLVASTGRRRWTALVVPAALAGAGGALATLAWTAPAGEPLRVVLVQGNVAQERKWLPEMREPTLDRYLALSRRHAGADLVVWPETALPGLYRSFGPFLRGLDREFAASGSGVLLGVPRRDEDSGNLFNSLVLHGSAQGVYHKRHLVPFGEYLPWRPLLLPLTKLLGVPSPDFDHGPDLPLPSIGAHPLGLSICYEIAFATEVASALPEAELLFTVSNDAWFGSSFGPHQHFQIARVRAMEAGRYLGRATNTGISGVVSPSGTVLESSPQFEIDVIEADMTPMSGATPYVTLGNRPVVGGALALLLAALVAGRRRQGRVPAGAATRHAFGGGPPGDRERAARRQAFSPRSPRAGGDAAPSPGAWRG